MAPKIEQVIGVRIRAYVEGLAQVQAFSASIRGLNNTGATGIARTSADIKDLSNVAKPAATNMAALTASLSNVGKAGSTQGIRKFASDLSIAVRGIQDSRRMLASGNNDVAGLLNPGRAVRLPAGREIITLKPLVTELTQVGQRLQTSVGMSERFKDSLRDLNEQIRKADRPKTKGLSATFLNTDKFEKTESDNHARLTRAAIANSAGAGFMNSPGIGTQAGAAKFAADLKKLETQGDQTSRSLTQKFNSATSSIFRFRAAIFLVSAALSALGAYAAGRMLAEFVQEGIRVNAEIEKQRISYAALIQATHDLTDANGTLLTGVDAANAAFDIAGENATKLRIKMIPLGATTSQLFEHFNTVFASGMAAGLTMEQLENTFVSLAGAAQVLGIPIANLGTEIRLFMSGTTRETSRLGTSLFGSAEAARNFVKEHKAAGDLYEALQAKLESYNLALLKSANSYTVLRDNVTEVFELLTSFATRGLFEQLKKGFAVVVDGIFDLTSGKLKPRFQSLFDFLNQLMTSAGEKIVRLIEGAVDLLGRAADYINYNWQEASQLAIAFYEIGRQIGGILIDLASVITDIVRGRESTDSWADTFSYIAILLATMRDVINIILGTIQTLLGLIVSGLSSIGQLAVSITNTIFGGWIPGLQTVADIMGYLVDASAAFANRGVDRAFSGMNFDGFNSTLNNLSNPSNKPITAPSRPSSFGFRRRPGGGAGAGSGGAGGADRAARERLKAAQQLNDAIESYLIANAKREADLVADGNKIILSLWQRRYDKGLESAEAFYKKKQTLELEDIAAEEKALKKSEMFARNALRRELGAIQGQFNLDENGTLAVIAQIEQMDTQGLVSASTTLIKQAAAYTKYLEQNAQIKTDLVKLTNRRTDLEAKTTDELAEQVRLNSRLMDNLAGETANALGSSAGLDDFLKLQQRVADELPKILTETMKNVPGVADFAKDIASMGSVSVDSLKDMLAEAGIEFSSLSDEARTFIRLIERLSGLAEIRSVTANVDRIQGNLAEDTQTIRDRVDRQEVTGADGRSQILETQTAAAGALRIELAEVQRVIADLEAKGVATDVDRRFAAALQREINTTVGTGVFEDVETEVNSVMSRLEARRAEVQRQFRDDKISEIQLRDMTLAIEREEAVVLQQLIAEMEKLPNLTLQQAAALESLRGQVADLGVATDAFAVSINQQIAGGLSTFFDELVDAPNDVLTSFQKMVSGMLLGIAKVIMQSIVLKAILSALGIGAGSGGGGFGGFLSGLLGTSPGMAEGGFVSGQGTSISDSILTPLSHGEAIIPADSVRRYGRGMIQSLINGSFIPRVSNYSYATGGFQGERPSRGGGSGRPTRIINSVDPNLVKDYMSSAEGEEIIVNIIGRNPGLIQRLVN